MSRDIPITPLQTQSKKSSHASRCLEQGELYLLFSITVFQEYALTKTQDSFFFNISVMVVID